MEPGWRKTWEDSEEDFVCLDADGRMIGRAYLSPQLVWRWFFAGMTGRAESRREALLAVEQAYERSQSARITTAVQAAPKAIQP